MDYGLQAVREDMKAQNQIYLPQQELCTAAHLFAGLKLEQGFVKVLLVAYIYLCQQ